MVGKCMSKIKSFKIDKNKLGKKIGCVAGSESDNGLIQYKNIVIGYIDDIPIFIKTNLNQSQWDKFCNGKLTKEELHRII
jgi:hypothetical protein